ncbi:MAG: hypothetical protein IPN26_09425 [Bacteroidetes bacterium]|nr:hypothetical protein [Bacteroidota bacterium]
MLLSYGTTFHQSLICQQWTSPDVLLQDSGRYKITHQPSDAFLFKVPTLRNIAWSYPYMMAVSNDLKM